MSSSHSPRHSHERNLEKSLEKAPRPATLAGAAVAGLRTEASPDPGIAARLAREAAEREAARRAVTRTESGGGG